eukprot:gene9774-biopygen3779
MRNAGEGWLDSTKAGRRPAVWPGSFVDKKSRSLHTAHTRITWKSATDVAGCGRRGSREVAEVRPDAEGRRRPAGAWASVEGRQREDAEHEDAKEDGYDGEDCGWPRRAAEDVGRCKQLQKM